MVYGFTRFRTAQSFGDPDDLMILTNHDRGYTDRFIGDRLYADAPMVRWAAENVRRLLVELDAATTQNTSPRPSSGSPSSTGRWG